MEVYIFLFVLIVVGAFLDISNVPIRVKYSFIVLIGFICVILSGIRWNTGIDWEPYLSYFLDNNTIDDFLLDYRNFESGYAYLNYFIKLVFDQYTLLLLIISIFIITLKYRTIIFFSGFPLVALCLNFINSNGDLFPVRQSISYAITFFSTFYIVRRKLISFFLFIIFAMSFHMSAICFLPAYWIYELKFSRRQLFMFLLVSIFLGSTTLAKNIVEFLVSITIGIDLDILIKLYNYLDESNMESSSNYSGRFVILLGILRRCFFFPVLIVYRDRLLNVYSFYNGFLNLTIFGACFFYLFSSIGVSIAGRGSFYYSIYEIFIIPYVLFWNKKLWIKMCLFFILLFYCIIKYFYGIYGFYDLLVPYKSIL